MGEEQAKDKGNGKPSEEKKEEPQGIEVPPDPAWPTFVTAEEVSLFLNPKGDLCLTLQGLVSFPRVKVRRAFPLTHPRRYVGFANHKDEHIALVRDPRSFDAATRHLVVEEMRRRYMTSKIVDIYSVRERHGIGYWHVETDRGEVKFAVRGLRDNVRDLGPRRLLIVDVDGNRYEIPDYSRLSRQARGQIERII